MKSRLIAVGDIHGEFDKLNSLLNKLNLTDNDTTVFLGDYIDRGNNSKEVIERLIELSKQTSCIFLKGNHEDLLLKTIETRDEEDIAHWLISGGITTFDNYGDFPSIFNLHGEFFDNLRMYYKTDNYLFVHAGINPEKTLEEQNSDDLLWIREEFFENPHNLKQKIIFGHTIFDKPYIKDDKIGINTGCGVDKNGYLTAYICYEETFITSD